MASEAVLPLEKRERTCQKTKKKLICLHPQWMFSMKCVLYEPLDSSMNCADISEWQERLQYLVNDYRELLRLEYSMFWCQVIFEPTIIPSVNSYLKAAPRPYDLNPIEIPSECSDLHEELHRLVFLVILRLSTYKESKTDFMTPSVFAEIIYDNYIFDITKLLDICCLYGQANQKLVTKMIENIFMCQPKYKTDLIDWFSIMKKVLDKFRGDSKFASKSGSPQKLGRITEHLSDVELVDRLIYAADVLSSLDCFLQINTFLMEDFLNNKFEQLIADLFEDLVPHFQEEIKLCKFKQESDRQLCRRALKRFSQGALSVYRRIIFPVCLGPLVESHPERSFNLVESFTNTTINILGYRRFLAALEHRYPFVEDLDFIRQSGFGANIDDAQVSFIINAAESAKQEFSSAKKSRRNNSSQSITLGKTSKKSDSRTFERFTYEDEPGCPIQAPSCQLNQEEGACAEQPDLAVLISTVQDILPDLGAGFIQRCLLEYNNCSEKVINAILEGSLPPTLASLDHSLPLQPDRNPGTPEVLRHSIFDGDEFDHKTGQKLDMSRIHQGKRDKSDDLPSESKEQLVNQYGTVEEWEESHYVNEEFEYDDEFDDTYESHLASVYDDEKDAMLNRRPWVVPRALGGGRAEIEQTNDEQNEEANEDSGNLSRGNENDNRRPKLGNNGDQSNVEERRTYDVRGRGRGRGQTTEVTRNRQFKDRHKASKANHNRRYFADKKRQRTGIP